MRFNWFYGEMAVRLEMLAVRSKGQDWQQNFAGIRSNQSHYEVDPETAVQVISEYIPTCPSDLFIRILCWMRSISNPWSCSNQRAGGRTVEADFLALVKLDIRVPISIQNLQLYLSNESESLWQAFSRALVLFDDVHIWICEHDGNVSEPLWMHSHAKSTSSVYQVAARWVLQAWIVTQWY